MFSPEAMWIVYSACILFALLSAGAIAVHELWKLWRKPDNEPDLDVDARELIVSLRGGVPEKCDFCGQPRPEHELHPEEGGEWACIHCIDKWKADGTLGY